MLVNSSQYKKWNSRNWRSRGIFIFCVAIITGMFVAPLMRILSAVGIGGLVLLALFQPNIKQKLGALVGQKYFRALAAIFLLHVLTFFYTDAAHYHDWWIGVVLKLPFLLLPLAFGLLPAISDRQFYLLYYIFLVGVFITALYSLNQYIWHFAEVHAAYSRSKVMPTLINHVRYSLMVAFAFFIGCRLWQKKFYLYHPTERYLLAGITVFLFFFMHLLAVRSGLLALYGVIGFSALYLLLIKKSVKLSLLLGLSLVLIPVIGYWALPTFHKKIYIIIDDWQSLKKQTSANHHSITGRYYSYKVGFSIFKEHPVVGVGLGNMLSEVKRTYRENFPEIKPEAYLVPHSQYIYYLMLFGLLGFGVFLFGFFYPLGVYYHKADVLFGVHYIIIALSFLTEATLETQLGLMFSLFFILLPLYQLPDQAANTKLNGKRI